VEGLAEKPAQDTRRLAAGSRTGAERTLGAALRVAGKTGDEEGQDGQNHTYGNNTGDNHESAP
jgi:hypothetical protein